MVGISRRRCVRTDQENCSKTNLPGRRTLSAATSRCTWGSIFGQLVVESTRDRQFSADEILLIPQTLVSRDQYVKFCFSGIEQGTVVEIGPPDFIGRRHAVSN